MKRPGGVTAIAIYLIITGGAALLGFCTLVGLPAFGLLGDVFSDAGLFALATAGTCFAIFMLLDAVLSLVGGYGLLKMREWGRFLGIFLALFQLLAFPVGTLIGAVILWYLFSGEVKEAFALEADPFRAAYSPDEDVTPADEKDFQYYPPAEHEAQTPAPPPDPVTGEEAPSGGPTDEN